MDKQNRITKWSEFKNGGRYQWLKGRKLGDKYTAEITESDKNMVHLKADKGITFVHAKWNDTWRKRFTPIK